MACPVARACAKRSTNRRARQRSWRAWKNSSKPDYVARAPLQQAQDTLPPAKLPALCSCAIARRLVRPTNLLQNRSQAPSLLRVDHLHKSHAPLKVRPKTRTPLAVLTLGSQSNAVGQHSLQPVEIASSNVWTLVGHESRSMLPHSLAHDPRLAMIHRE